jgi:hypothetical protein
MRLSLSGEYKCGRKLGEERKVMLLLGEKMCANFGNGSKERFVFS